MKVGTKSLLFGVHAFWWHPIVVFLAWCKLYKKLPTFPQLLGIILHDIGYWGCTDMDGQCGKSHPYKGAAVVEKIITKLYGEKAATKAFLFTAFHSASYAKAYEATPSALCAPDKFSIVFEPRWFYLLRARLSGELTEYKANAQSHLSDDQWFDWLEGKFKKKYGTTAKDKNLQP
jgi:hypothetical protein